MATVDSNNSLKPSTTASATATAFEVKAALDGLAIHAPDYAPLLRAARDIITRLETEKHEALFCLHIKQQASAEALLRRQAEVEVTMPKEA